MNESVLQHVTRMPVSAFVDDDSSLSSSPTARAAMTRKIILGFLASFADQSTGFCWATNESMVELTGNTERTVQNTTRWLADNGMIAKISTYDKNGYQLANCYAVLTAIDNLVEAQAMAVEMSERIMSENYGPNVHENGTHSLNGSAASIVKANSAWWDGVRKMILDYPAPVQKMGFDDLLELAEKPTPPGWLKEWMMPDPNDKDGNIRLMSESPGFIVFYVSFLYHKHFNTHSDYKTKRGARSELLQLSRIKWAKKNGQFDKVMAARIVYMAIMKRWVGLPREEFIKSLDDVPMLPIKTSQVAKANPEDEERAALEMRKAAAEKKRQADRQRESEMQRRRNELRAA